MKKRWIVLLLTVALVLGLAVFAMAAGEEAKPVIGPNGEMYHCVCGNQHYAGEGAEAALVVSYGECYEDCDGANHTWLPWTRKGGAYNNGEWYYYLDKNILPNDVIADSVLYKTVVIGVSSSNTSIPVVSAPSDFYLDLNGYSYAGDYRLFRVDGTADYSASLTISDSSKNNTGKLIAETTDYGAVAWLRYAYATAKIYGGTLESVGTTTGNGGTINSAGTLNIFDGTITGGTSANGGNICQSGGTLTMTGGVVEDGATTGHGGNIRVENGAIVKITGGIIRNGTTNTTADSNGANLGIVGAATTVTIAGEDSVVAISGGTANRGTAIFFHSGSLTIGSNVHIENGTASGALYTGGPGVAVNGTSAALTLTGNPRIEEVYLRSGTIQVTDLAIDASIGLSGDVAVDTALTAATLDVAVAGCFHSTRDGYNLVYNAANKLIFTQDAASCICGAYNRTNGVHTEGCYSVKDVEWTTVTNTSALTAPTDEGTVYVRLGGTVTLSSELSWSVGHMVIDLNGHELIAGYKRMFKLSSSASLTIADTSADQTGKVTYSRTDGGQGGMVQLNGSSTLYVFGGTLDASQSPIDYGNIARVNASSASAYIHGGTMLGGTSQNGGGAFSSAGTIYMTGGTIYGGSHTGSTYGGGALNIKDGKLYMSGNARIVGGTTKTTGGVIYVRSATLTMSDNATIDGTDATSASNGGAVYMHDAASIVTIDGGTIIGGAATGGGGAVYMNNGTLTINGGTIRGGTATTNGGTIFQNGGTLSMTGGTIIGGTAGYGGGAICTLATTNISGGKILGGTSNYITDTKRGGGAIFVAGGTTTISGDAMIGSGTYEGTTYTSTAKYGAAVHINSGTLNINGGIIHGGTGTEGGAVFVFGGTLTINNGTIYGGSVARGGAIFVNSGRTVTMHGGTIYAGNATDNGGAISVFSTDAKFIMNGGTIDAAGKTVGHGVAIGNNAGEVVINGGLIIGGTSTGSGGAAISSFTSGNKFTMNGGTITGGIHNGSDTVGRGGAVRVSGGTLVMTGGTITGGTNKVGVGGGLMVTGTSSATISGNVVITGNTDKNGNASNLYLDGTNKIAIGEGGLGNQAKIGVSMTTPGAFTAANASDYATKFISDNGSYYVVYNADTCLALVLKTEYAGTIAAIVNSTPFDTAQGAVDAVTDSANQYVKLMAAVNGGLTINKNLYLDLNGNTITGNISNSGCTLYAFDSFTDDYIAGDTYGKIVGTISGEYSAEFVTPKALFGHQYRYIAIDEGNNTHSFHRIYLGVKSVVLYPTTTAIDYKITLRCDEVVAEHITDYGLKAYATAYQTAEPDSAVAVSPTQTASAMQSGILPYGEECNENIRKVRIVNVLNDTMNFETQQLRAERFYFTVCAYITLDSEEIASASATNSLEEVVKTTESYISESKLTPNINQLCSLSAMYGSYSSLMESWFEDEAFIPNITWQEWDGKTAITEEGNYRLTADATTDALALSGGVINIDLNGYSITANGGQRVFSVAGSATVNVTNSKATGGSIIGKLTTTTENGGVVLVEAGGSFNLYTNVAVDGSGTNVKQGGAIYLSGSASMTMNGSTVIGGSVTSDGGAIKVNGSATLTMNGGQITAEGQTAGYGTAIRIESNGALNMNGGTITGGTSTTSGGGAISSAGTINMTGGTIHGGEHNGTAYGGGALNIKDGKLYMSGNAKIVGGSTNLTGGVIYVRNATLTMSDNATIDGTDATSASNGGAVYMHDAASIVTINGGTILGGTTTTHGGAIFQNAGTLTINGGTVIGGTATVGGGAIFALGGTTTISGGKILGGQANSTGNYGGGAVMISGATVTVSGDAVIGSGTDGETSYTSKAQKGAAVYLKSGSLTINGGTINGGSASTGGAIRAESGTTITMKDGTISGGTATNGGCVFLEGATMTMSGGIITGGEASSKGGGVLINGGSLTMTGGSITGNDALYDYAGGVHVNTASSKLIVSGNAQITGNTNNGGKATSNVYLVDSATIDIGTAVWTEDARIGVTLAGVTGAFTSAEAATDANAAHFFSDASYEIVVDEAGLMVSEYLVGYGEASIDPNLEDGNSYGLLGYGNHDSGRNATSIEVGNGLLATCIAVTDGEGDTVLLISIDAAYISPEASTEAKRQITQATGVPAENIMISAAHQHSTPTLETNYLNKYFYPGIVAASKAAMADRAAVTGVNTSTVETASNGVPQFGFVRNITLYYNGELQGTWAPNHDGRVYPYGEVKNGSYINYEYDGDWMQYLGGRVEYKICSTVAEAIAASANGKYAMCYETVVDSDLQLVKFERATGNIIMANFQVHPTLASTSSTTVITADVVGAFRNALESATGAKVMYFSGASGDINPDSYLGDTVYQKTANEGEDIGTAHRDYGQALAALVYDGDYKVEFESVETGDVSVAYTDVTLEANTNTVPSWLEGSVTVDQIEVRAAEIWDAASNQYIGEWTSTDKATYGIYSKYHAKYIAERAGVAGGTTKTVTINAYSIGEIAFVAAPYEMFCTNGQQIKEGSGFDMTFIATQANGNNHYIPSADGYTNGGYSTDITEFAAGTGEALVTEYLTLLSSLKTAN